MAHLTSLDPQIFQAIAGTSFQIPTVDSSVYYFPQGHAEHFSTPLPNAPSHSPFILSQISAVRFLADPDTDEVFVSICLQSLPHSSIRPLPVPPPADPTPPEKTIVSFAKILTPSDANNGGGFSVPRFCADSIFPPLNFEADPPVQTITVRDVHGVAYEFRHIYRGTPRRHLLTTGWSRFVNSKKLVAGDSVVFMRNCRSGELFAGVRRTARSCGSGGGYLRWHCRELEDGFLRGGQGRAMAETVAEAVQLAGKGRPFKVVYYPRVGSADFVVRAEAVEVAMKVHWMVGMRVKMAVETEDSARMAWYQGTVSSVGATDGGPWRGSPWRMLQVTWDEPDVLPNVKRVSPWQVELVPNTAQIQFPFPPTKKIRLPQSPEFPADGGGPMFLPLTGLTNTMTGHVNPSLFNFNTSPAGMQGARHDPICVSTNFIPKQHHSLFSDNFFGNKMSPKVSCVSTELNIGSTSRSENSSPKSQGSVHFVGEELFSNQTCKATVKDGGGSFQLFGQTIQTKQPVEGGSFGNGVRTNNDASKGYKEIGGVGGTLDFSLTNPYKQLYDQLDVQCQRVSAVEACSL
ncbi:auxin response factor 17-like [Magnolia sinica]|uniref:auxin response factor 17-like n=1 Tax=Magnolia sinica TaxID=86752 RepID=UPI00265AB0B2|nr:auxin response factor 17-like [Magnolia sinica]XP_058091312.1 auxin response factor 17-like [Magnolia sinica]XP_058091313.1 auxin response factor 17-like [Magnolia sinica]